MAPGSAPAAPSPAPAVVCDGLSYAWPDGTAVLRDLTWTAGQGRTGLVGSNGSGKTTLLRLIAGQLAPGGGTVRVTGELGYLPQQLILDSGLRVDEVLGIARTRAALHAIESGETHERYFATVGDDWDVEERALAALAQLGLGHIDLDRVVGELSGGEAVLLSLAARFLARPDVLLLDEPTNNLDRRARHQLYEAVGRFRGALIVVSHDRELLRSVDRIAELRCGAVRNFGGNLDVYEETVAAEQEAAARRAGAARALVDRERRDLAEAGIRRVRSARQGRRLYADNRRDKATAQYNKRSAQFSAGRERGVHEQRLTEAQERLTEAEEQVRSDAVIRVDLPETAVPPGRKVLTLQDLRLHSGARIDRMELYGPQRVALTGDNGSGKTTLLRTLAGLLPAPEGQATVHVPLGYLPQRLDPLDGSASVAQHVARLAPAANPNRVRARLARFLFRGKQADRPADTLSGGERLRAALAALLLAEPAPQLLLLDEPTNNLDLSGVRRLTEALAGYRGALLVASHDLPFLRELGTTHRLHLDGSGHPAVLDDRWPDAHRAR